MGFEISFLLRKKYSENMATSKPIFETIALLLPFPQSLRPKQRTQQEKTNCPLRTTVICSSKTHHKILSAVIVT